MRLACCQMDIAWEDKGANRARARRLLKGARLEPGTLALLPEMFATGFSMNVAGIAEEPGGETEAFLGGAARELDLYLVAGLVTRASDGRGWNEAVAVGPQGQELARYQKMHPFSYGGEAAYYAPGAAPRLFGWQGVTVAPFVCYDLRFPEVFRSAVRQGAHLFTVIANWPAAREAHWVALLRARAIENQAYVAGVNRCGDDPKLHYTGRSLVLDPRGEVLAEAGDSEEVISAEVDLEALTRYRGEFPALQDMHPEYVR